MGYLTKLLRLAAFHCISVLTCNVDLISSQTVHGGEENERNNEDFDNGDGESQQDGEQGNNNNQSHRHPRTRSCLHRLTARALSMDPNQLTNQILCMMYMSILFDIVDIMNFILDMILIVRMYQYSMEDFRLYASVMLVGAVLGRLVSWRGTTLLFRHGIQWHPFWIKPQWPMMRQYEKSQRLQTIPDEDASDEEGRGEEGKGGDDDREIDSNNDNNDWEKKNNNNGITAMTLTDDKNQRALLVLYCLVFTEGSVFFLEDFPSLVVYDEWMVLSFPPPEFEYLDDMNVAMSAAALAVLCLFFLMAICLSLYFLLQYDWKHTWTTGILKSWNASKIIIFIVACGLILRAVLKVAMGAVEVVIRRERRMPSNTILGDLIELCPSTSFQDRDELCAERIFLVRVGWAWLAAFVFAAYLIWFPAQLQPVVSTPPPPTSRTKSQQGSTPDTPSEGQSSLDT